MLMWPGYFCNQACVSQKSRKLSRKAPEKSFSCFLKRPRVSSPRTLHHFSRKLYGTLELPNTLLGTYFVAIKLLLRRTFFENKGRRRAYMKRITCNKVCGRERHLAEFGCLIDKFQNKLRRAKKNFHELSLREENVARFNVMAAFFLLKLLTETSQIHSVYVQQVC